MTPVDSALPIGGNGGIGGRTQRYPQVYAQGELPCAAAVADPVVDAMIRREVASIYSTTVPEHHSEHQPAPAAYTVWERARLSRAARTLREN